MTDVRGYLESKSLQLKSAGPSNVHTACFFCGEDDRKRGRLYVNIDPSAEIPGLYHCKLCDAKGSLVSLKKYFGDVDERAVESDADHNRLQILAAAATYYHEALGDHPQAFEWLRVKRGLGLSTIVEHQLGYADGGLYSFLRDQGYRTADLLNSGLVIEDRRAGRATDSLHHMVTIPYHVSGNVMQIRGRTFPYKGDGYPEELDGPKYKTPPNQKSRLFNSGAAWDAEELIVTEGEFDAMVLSQAGFAAVGVPGANGWQDAWDGYLETVKRVYVTFDNDSAGVEGAAKLRDRFGPKVRVVEMPLAEPGKPKNDPTEWLIHQGHTAADFRELLELTDSAGLLVTVDQAAVEHLEIQGLDGIRLGIEDLDAAINPGLLPYQLMVILAKSGTGKTLILLNSMHRMAQTQPDLKFLFVSLEQTRGEWFERARRIFRFYNLNADDDDVLDFWRERMLMVDKNRLSQTDFNAVLDDYEYRMGRVPDVVMVDYLGYWAQSFKGDRYERTSDAVMALKQIAKERRTTIIAPHQISRMTKYGEEPDADTARDAGVIEETADFVLMLWSPDHAPIRGNDGSEEEHKSGLVHCRVGKSRHGGRGSLSTLQFAPQSLVLLPHHSEDRNQKRLMEMARNELFYASVNEAWEVSHLRHRGELDVGVPDGPFSPGPAHQQPQNHHQLAMRGTRRR